MLDAFDPARVDPIGVDQYALVARARGPVVGGSLSDGLEGQTLLQYPFPLDLQRPANQRPRFPTPHDPTNRFRPVAQHVAETTGGPALPIAVDAPELRFYLLVPGYGLVEQARGIGAQYTGIGRVLALASAANPLPAYRID